jgi:succinoglycan biosynthesis protein ExoM
MKISLCIATCLRPEKLDALLADLARQQLLPAEVVVVDNDAAGSARAIVERHRRLAPFPIHYDMQTVKNISLTRNRTVAMASCDWLGFIDDDERAPPEWLEQIAAAVARFNADVVLGPVVPVLPAGAPAWIQRGRFYDWPRMTTGARVPPNRLRFGNVLLRASLLHRSAQPFDPVYGLTGGEDGDLLTRLVQRGASIVWCDAAIVLEPVDPARLTLRWLLLRALRGGQDFARHRLLGRYEAPTAWNRLGLLLRSAVQAVVAAGMAILSWPGGRHRGAYWLLKVSANLGKLSAFFGWHYREYKGTAQ